MKIKPIIYNPKKGRKFINYLTLKKIDSDNELVNVTYEELPKFLKINHSNDKKALVKLNPKYKYQTKGKKVIKSLSCNLISDDNQISNKNINISFQEFNDNDYQLELINNIENKIKKYEQTLDSLIKIKNQIQELEIEKNSNISNILEWTTNIATISAGAVSIIPVVGTMGSAIATVTSGACAIANSIIKNKPNYNEIKDLKMENTNNFISIQIENEINSLELSSQPSISENQLTM